MALLKMMVLCLLFVACMANEGGHHPLTEDKPTNSMSTNPHEEHKTLSVVRDRRDAEAEHPAPMELEPVEHSEEANDDTKTAETFWWKYGHHGFDKSYFKFQPHYQPYSAYPYPYSYYPHYYYKKW